MAAIPIWKDKVIEIGDEDWWESCPYRISVKGIPGYIYEGSAFPRPGDVYSKVKINDICADFLHHTLPTLSKSEFDALSFPLTFTLEWYNAEGDKWMSESVQFLNNWSYDRSYNASTMGMADPINGHIDANQWMVWTGLSVTSVKATLTYANGRTSQVTIPVSINSKFANDTDFYRSLKSAGSGTAVFNLSSWSDLSKIEINGKTYKVVSDCRRYVLYYLNAYGGWDSLLIEGNTKESDAITRYTGANSYDNAYAENRGERNYVNEVTKTFTLVTGWMSDEESARMHHLINSTDVYLYDIVTQEMLPVIIPSTSCDRKRYKSNGCKLVNYTITANVAQTIVRR